MAEQFKNTPTPSSPSTAWTTLDGALDDSQTNVTVVDLSVFPASPEYRLLIDNEILLVTAHPGGEVATATRGAEGTTAAAHDSGASVYHILTAGSLALLPVALGNVTGLGTNVATFLATPSSANLAAAVTDETGSGALVFATSPTLVTPTLGAASATSVLVDAGSAGSPSLRFVAGAAYGFYFDGASRIMVVCGGSIRADVSEAGLNVRVATLSLLNGVINLVCTAAGVVEQRTTTTAQSYRLYYSYTNASNYARLALNTGSAAMTIACETAGTGADDIDLALTPAGAGLVQFGTHASLGGESVTGYITIKDAGGTSRKVAVVS